MQIQMSFLGRRIGRLCYSQNRNSNLESFATLAGTLSELRFPTVSSRFLLEINKVSGVKESKGELLIKCMRHLKLKVCAI